MSGVPSITRLLALLNLLLLLSEPALCSIPCPLITKAVAPCLNYLIGKSNYPSPVCCAGAKDVWELSKTKPDKQAACECLKKILRAFKYDPNRIVKLPPKCRLKFTLPPVSPTYDCSKISYVSGNLAG